MRDLTSYVRALIGNWWFRLFFFLSVISTTTTFYVSFHPGFLLPKTAPLIVALVALLISPYDVYKRQQGQIQALLQADAELQDSQHDRSARELANLISELEDNLTKARSPVIDRSFGGGTYVRPSTDCWKAVRNLLQLNAQLRDRVSRVYADVDRWWSIVDSGLKLGIGSPELNAIVARLCGEIPALLQELRKAQRI